MSTAMYKEHTIQIDETTQFRFVVTGPHYERKDSYDTYSTATEAIDRRIRNAEKQKRTEQAIALASLDAGGNPCTVKGVHATRHTLLGVPAVDLGYSRNGVVECYPDQPWLRTLLAERIEVQKRSLAIENALRRVRIGTDRRYTGTVNYDDLIARLLTEHGEKMRLAEEEQARRDAAVVGR